MNAEVNDRQYQEWKRKVAREQQALFIHFGNTDVDKIQKNRLNLIRAKISWYAFNDDYDNLVETKKRKERSTVDKTIEKLMRLSGDEDDLYLGCFYVNIRLKKDASTRCIPVFKIKKRENDESTMFYEVHSDRVYKEGWEEYIKDTKLPPCWMGFPEKGVYKSREDGGEMRVRLEFCKSPSFDSVLPVTDTISAVGGVLGVGVAAASIFFPPLLAVEVAGVAGVAVLASSGIYGFVRSACELIDRDQHEQNCRPSNPEAFSHWLNMLLSGGCIFSSSSNMIVRLAMEKGLTVTANAMTILRCISLGMNCTGVFLTMGCIVAKFFSEDGLTSTDLKTFASLIFFVTNIIITIPQSRQIIEIFVKQPHRMCAMFNMVAERGVFSSVNYVVYNLPFTDILNTCGRLLVMCVLSAESEMLTNVRRTLHFVERITRECQENLPKGWLKICAHQTLIDMITLVEREKFRFEGMLENMPILPMLNLPTDNRPTGSLNSDAAVSFLSCRTSGPFVLEVMDEVHCIVQSIGFSDLTIVDEVEGSIIERINQIGTVKVNFRNEAERLRFSNFICKEFGRQCTGELILENCEMTEERKLEIFRRILRNFDDDAMVENFQEQERINEQRMDTEALLSCRPTYQTADTSIYYFEVLQEGEAFDNFVNRTIREHFGTENVYSSGRQIHMRPQEKGISVSDGEKTVVITYDKVVQRTETLTSVLVLTHQTI